MKCSDINLFSLAPSFGHKQKSFRTQLEGTKTTGVVRCDQPRVLDLVARKAKKLESVSMQTMDEVLAKLATLIS